MSKTFKIVDVDTGFCRVTYKTKSPDNKWIYYCLQDNGDSVEFYRSTREYEPMYPVSMRVWAGLKATDLFEVPTGDSTVEGKVRLWIQTN